MPKGPKGEKRPADVIGAAIMVAKIATGEIDEPKIDSSILKKSAAGKKGGAARSSALDHQTRHEAAQKAAAARWAKK
jgi:hypothetical protein